ncbi:MAG TPA: hypothetical protein VFA21_12795 [Pyrinomonadaceae bacterium]|nr:hypothetical protein [Pyrinomonadaceae bacterium]
MRTRKIAASVLLLAAVVFAAAGEARAQTEHQDITVTVRPSQTVEERVADEMKEKELRKAAEEKSAAEESEKIAETSPRMLLARARTIYVTSSTSYFEPVQLQNALRKRDEVDDWQLAIVDGWDKQKVADILIEVDRPLFTWTFTYKITQRSTGIILATGKITAFDGNAAAPKLARRIVEDIREARGEKKAKK